MVLQDRGVLSVPSRLRRSRGRPLLHLPVHKPEANIVQGCAKANGLESLLNMAIDVGIRLAPWPAHRELQVGRRARRVQDTRHSVTR